MMFGLRLGLGLVPCGLVNIIPDFIEVPFVNHIPYQSTSTFAPVRVHFAR